jgi:hypothetical protein
MRYMEGYPYDERGMRRTMPPPENSTWSPRCTVVADIKAPNLKQAVRILDSRLAASGFTTVPDPADTPPEGRKQRKTMKVVITLDIPEESVYAGVVADVLEKIAPYWDEGARGGDLECDSSPITWESAIDGYQER